jgi:hypothetical protein
MDRLEEHIRKNREDLDRYNPSPDVWKEIHRDLRKGRRIITPLRSVAASVIVIAGISVLFSLKNRNNELSGSVLNGNTESVATPQLKETEIYYNNLVTSLYKEATPLLTGNPEMEKELTSDISQLDSICSQIKKDLRDNVDNQEVVEALIQNYRIKIRILEDMVTVLKEDNNNKEKSKGHEL